MKRKKKTRRRLLRPRLRYRLLCYGLFLLFGILSGVQLIAGLFPPRAGMCVDVLAAVLMLLSCVFAVPDIRQLAAYLRRVLSVLKKNFRFLRYFLDDTRYRTFVLTGMGLLLNLAFAAFNSIIGVMADSAWYLTLALYYALLSLMRFWTVSYERRLSRMQEPGARRRKEIAVYRNCSVSIIFMTGVLSGMVILTVAAQAVRSYPGTTIYVMALYTFYKVPMAMRNWIVEKKNRTPVLLTIRMIAFTDACVSVLSLQTAMFSSFGTNGPRYEAMMSGITGGLVCIAVLAMGIYSAHDAQRLKKEWKT